MNVFDEIQRETLKSLNTKLMCNFTKFSFYSFLFLMNAYASKYLEKIS